RAILPLEHYEASTEGVGLAPKGRAARGTDIVVPKLEQLNEMQSYAYTLTSDMAAKLSILTSASISASRAKSVHVLEWAKFVDLERDDGSVLRWGCAARLCITVSKTQGQGSMSLPFLAAEAQLGQIEASWMLNIRGARGSKIEQKLLPPQNLDVKTYVLAEK